MAYYKSGKKVISRDNIFGGSGRLVYADNGTAEPTDISDILDIATSPYALETGWNDFGGTEGGATLSRSYEMNEISVDQVAGVFDKEVTDWTMSVQTELAETTLENIQIAWVGSSAITTVTGVPSGYPVERKLGLGAPTCLPERMIALIVDKKEDCAAGESRVRAHVFWIAQIDGAESAQPYVKGDKTVVPVTFNILPDPSKDEGEEFGIILDQANA